MKLPGADFQKRLFTWSIIDILDTIVLVFNYLFNLLKKYCFEKIEGR